MTQRLKDLMLASASELGIYLDAEQMEKFHLFAVELIKWNRKINLTAITDERDVVLKHFADSLLLLKVVSGAGTLLDIGSGGGFPAIPLKIVLPTLSVVSVDAVEKKILFQRHVARLLALENFVALHARGEQLAKEYSQHFDCIVSRAFSDIHSFATMALPLMHSNGSIIAMKGKRGGEEAASVAPELECMGLIVDEVIETELPVSGDPRTLVVLKKSN